MLRVGVLVNPIAGLGGAVGLKGSDGVLLQAQAIALGARPRSIERMRAALAVLADSADRLRVVAWGGAMGADALADSRLDHIVVGEPKSPSDAADTTRAVRALCAHGVDVLLFAGGDGTARDIASAIEPHVPMLGVPAGVKMHSGVFAVTPADAGAVIRRLARGELVAIDDAELRDVDEGAVRAGRAATRSSGFVRSLRLGGYVQHVKSEGRENEDLVKVEIAHEIAERARNCAGAIVLGPGTTVAAVKRELGVEPTLLGIDVWRAGRTLARDVAERDLDAIVDASTVVVVGFAAQQGILFGRGNQALSARILARVARENVWVVASRTKLATLGGAALRVDTGDVALDTRFGGTIEIVAGYDDRLLYRIGRDA